MNFGAVKVSKKKAVRAMRDELCKGTSEGGGTGGRCTMRLLTHVLCKHRAQVMTTF